ncbi:hypothetical protein R1flu_021212 [Riccia fluitans]|uniref:Uncharacterized protein n=1 Tax=Riccia fluitans TaxID=41844 RepID=A0ABD1ZNQ1_9MARC
MTSFGGSAAWGCGVSPRSCYRTMTSNWRQQPGGLPRPFDYPDHFPELLVRPSKSTNLEGAFTKVPGPSHAQCGVVFQTPTVSKFRQMVCTTSRVINDRPEELSLITGDSKSINLCCNPL